MKNLHQHLVHQRRTLIICTAKNHQSVSRIHVRRAQGAEGAVSSAQSTTGTRSAVARSATQISVQREAPWKSAFMVITLSHYRAPQSKVFTRLCKGSQIRAESCVRRCQRNLSVWIVTPDLFPDKNLSAHTRSILPCVFVLFSLFIFPRSLAAPFLSTCVFTRLLFSDSSHGNEADNNSSTEEEFKSDWQFKNFSKDFLCQVLNGLLSQKLPNELLATMV